MCWDDMKQYFKWIDVCKIDDSFNYSYSECIQDKRDAYNLTKMMVESDGKMTISLCQNDKRCFKRTSQYDYSNARLIVMKIKSSLNLELEYVEGTMGKERDMHLELENLEAGEYFVFSEVENKEFGSLGKYVVSAYGASQV